MRSYRSSRANDDSEAALPLNLEILLAEIFGGDQRVFISLENDPALSHDIEAFGE